MLRWLLRMLGRSTRNPLADVVHDTAPVDPERFDRYHNSRQWGR